MFKHELRWYHAEASFSIIFFLFKEMVSMHTEYELRVLEVDKDKVIKKLKKIGAKFCWDQVQRRYVYDFMPKLDGKWIRLRTNGIKTTLTIKDIVSSKIDGTRELEVEVNDFDTTNSILNELGYVPKGYQENRR